MCPLFIFGGEAPWFCDKSGSTQGDKEKNPAYASRKLWLHRQENEKSEGFIGVVFYFIALNLSPFRLFPAIEKNSE